VIGKPKAKQFFNSLKVLQNDKFRSKILNFHPSLFESNAAAIFVNLHLMRKQPVSDSFFLLALALRILSGQ